MSEHRHLASRVSLLIPCYNGASFIDRAFTSILKQTEPQMEVVLVDDGSDDRSYSLALSYADRFREKGYSFIALQQSNGGAAAAIKLAMHHATGSYIQLLDIDDELTPDSSKLQADWLDANPEAAMVFANGIALNESNGVGNPVRRKLDTTTRNVFSELLSGELNNVPGMYMIRRDALTVYYATHPFYVSRYGQNLQMLMPPAKDALAGFVDRDALIYHIHSGSHSRPKQYTDVKANFDGYREIRMQLLRDMHLELPEYLKLVDVGYNRGMMLVAQGFGRKEEYCKHYEYVRRNGHLTWNEIADYHIYNHTPLQLPIRVLLKLRALLKL